MTSKDETSASIERRAVLKAGSLLVAAAAASGTASQAQAQAPTPGVLGDSMTNDPVTAIANTTLGKVQGIVNGPVKEFKGIPYGAPTGGANRFAPPKKAASWTGVRDAFGYAQVCPQTPAALTSDYSMMICWDRHVGPGGMGEDCLNLNVWTPGVDGAKRAVMVSFHGGGWATGSGNGPMYDGAQLAKFGDVVVVTVNHRLASYGYLHLPEYADSGNVGLLDMVASLEWVRDNAANFGGDPNRVMIFGQSGGGSKVSTLLATPSAKGLFHRAAIQSGSTLRQATPAEAMAETEKFVRATGVSRADLRNLTWQQMLQAQVKSGANFRPVVGGAALPQHPFDPSAPAVSADVPVIISTTLHDAAIRLTNFDLTEAGLAKIFNDRFGAKGPALLADYRKDNSTEAPYKVQAAAFTDATRGNMMVQGVRRAAQKAAPTYLYVWAWETPSFDGKFGAVHGHDVDASFYLYRNPICGSGSKGGWDMAKRMASSFVAFAKTGSPNNPTIPAWPAYEPGRRATMVFNTEMKVVDDYRGAFVRAIGETGPAMRA